MARTFKTMLNKSGESQHPFNLFLILDKMLSAFPLSMMLAVGFSYVAFIMLRYVCFMPTFWRGFILNGC